MSKRLTLLIIGLIVLAGLLLWARVEAGTTVTIQEGPAFAHARIAIRRADGMQIPLDVEVAISPQQKAYGLMYRRALAPGTGMIFLFNPDEPVSFWMKNTYIPLDMLFIRRDGSIARIITARPLDLTPIPSGEPVHAVLEIGGGEAARMGLIGGDMVLLPPGY